MSDPSLMTDNAFNKEITTNGVFNVVTGIHEQLRKKRDVMLTVVHYTSTTHIHL